MDRRLLMSPESAQASDIFDRFCTANTLKGIVIQYRQLCNVLKLKPTHFPEFYPRLKKLSSWRAQGLWTKFEKRASHKCYIKGKACTGSRVLIIGAGPCGLRTAIEAQLLGAKVVLIEKRDRFSRNNVLHLWPFVIADLKALGAKKFYGKFCAGSIDHISIRQLQCILLKVALLLGVEVHEGVGFEGLREPTEDEGWRAITSPVDHPVSHYCFDCLIGADGRRNTLEGFKRKALRAKLAIAITANFINKRTEAEARVKEISGVSYIFNQKFFQDLNEATGIDLENIVYYKDETHYFVMTAKKQSLLNKRVLLNDFADTAKLLCHENISTEALMIYALEAAIFSTENQLPNLEFAINHYGQPDVAMFDFTAMYAAENASRVIQRKGHKLMMSLVGDSLLEPFWPTGSGCARGFLSSFDACWMLKGLSSGTRSVLEVVAERESIYRLLGQTTPENLNKEHTSYTLDPHTRYPNLNQRVVMPFQVRSLFDYDETTEELDGKEYDLLSTERTTKKRRRDSMIPVDSLLNWLRDQVQCYGLEISSINEAFSRGNVLCAILHRFRPDLIEFPPTSEENLEPRQIVSQRNQIAFDFLQREYGITPVVTGDESVYMSSSEFHTLVAYLSQLYDTFKGEIPQIKYPRVEGHDDLEETSYRSSHSHAKHTRPGLVVKQGISLKVGRKARLSSSPRDSEHSEASRRHRKRRSDERSRVSVEERTRGQEEIERNRMERQRRRLQERILQTERFIKSMRMLQMNDRNGEITTTEDADPFEDYTFHLYRQMAPDFEDRCKSLEKKLFYSGKDVKNSSAGNSLESERHHVSGLARNLEEKLKGSRSIEKKPKDLIRAIGKIEKSDWNVQLIEKKIAENQSHGHGKKEQDKVPKWSREAYDDKREAMKRKMEGITEKCLNEKDALFDDTVKKLGTKLKEGNTLDIGQRGCNKVSQMAEQLSHKLERPQKDTDSAFKPPSSRPVFEFPTKGGSEVCHFCKQRVYVVERMTTEGKYFHRNCFRCEYCNTSLRLGNYVFDREGRYGDRFYCAPHYSTIRLYGWKKYDQIAKHEAEKLSSSSKSNYLTPASHQILSEMDQRGTTPERVEFENSVDFASEEELLSEMDEDEWTDRNFGASNAENNTSDEASDLSDDDDEVTPGGNAAPRDPMCHKGGAPVSKHKLRDSSDSDTEIASAGGSGSQEDRTSDEEDLEEEDEEECEGSTTEVETDSEFAEDPPHCVPGSIPTIVVNEPEQQITRVVETDFRKSSVAKTPLTKSGAQKGGISYTEENYGELPIVEPVLKNDLPRGRAFPKVYCAPKKWEPLATVDAQQEALAAKYSIELKQKYLNSTAQPKSSGLKKVADPSTQQQLTSVLDLISEKQKLLQPASKPSPTMQAFLEGAEKLKNKTTFGTVAGSIESSDLKLSPNSTSISSSSALPQDIDVQTMNMNLLNLEKTQECRVFNYKKSTDLEKDVQYTEGDPISSRSQSKTESQCTIIQLDQASPSPKFDGALPGSESCSESEVESISPMEPISDTDEVEEGNPERHEPPRVEIEDEFGVSLSLDDNKLLGNKSDCAASNSPQVMKHLSHCGMSSSDSKDSLNSGGYLETEMSEWSKDAGAPTTTKSLPSAKQTDTKRNNTENERINITVNDKKTLALNTESIDFVDIDGISIGDNGLECNISDKFLLHQSSILKAECSEGVGACQVMSSSAVSTERQPAETFQCSSLSNDQSSPNIVEVVNKSISYSMTGHPNPILTEQDKFTLLDRVVPFSKARDSLDYRKMKSIGSPIKSSMPFIQSDSDRSSITALLQPKVNYMQLNHESKVLSESEIIPFSLEAGELGLRPTTSPGTARRIEEISKERSKQNDLIRSMVMGRIRRSPEKSRRGSRGSLSQAGASSTSSIEFIAKDSKPKTPQSFGTEEKEQNKPNTNGDEFAKLEAKYMCRSHSIPGDNAQSSNDSLDDAHQSVSNRTYTVFESHLPVYQSCTNSPTFSGKKSCASNGNSPNQENYSGKDRCPNFYRSMPDLSVTCSEITPERTGKPKVNKVSSFATPNIEKWEDDRTASAISREKAREAARERARLKSDEELGLVSTENYDILKDKLKRKLSITEDEVFNPNAAITTRVYNNELASPSTPIANSYSYSITPLRPTPVCFNTPLGIQRDSNPPQRSDPFLVSNNTDSPICEGAKNLSNDDFLQLHLRVAKPPTNEENSTNETENISKFPNYFSASATLRKHSLKERSKVSTSKGHTRSYTMSEINLKTGNPDLPDKVIPNPKEVISNSNGKFALSLGYSSTNTLSQPASHLCQFDSNSTDRKSINKAKALSTEMLLDSTNLSLPPENEAFRGVSVPDVTHDFVSSEKKEKKSKDRNRRKSLIQAVSDFFTPKYGSKTSGSTGENEKSSSVSSSSTPATPKEMKFSIFKLTPKLRQKEKWAPSANPENPAALTRSNEKSKNPKSPRSSFMSYISQPESVIQRLSSSPSTPSKSPQGHAHYKKESLTESQDAFVVQGKSKLSKQETSSAEKQRKNEILEIQLQLESIETDQRHVEEKGVLLERKLRGEEDDEGHDHAELMEEWFTLVREKIRLSRYEKELIVRAKQLDLSWKEQDLEEELEHTLLISEDEKLLDVKAREVNLFQELNSVKRQKEALLSSFHEDMMKYEIEDAELEAKCSTLPPRESNV